MERGKGKGKELKFACLTIQISIKVGAGVDGRALNLLGIWLMKCVGDGNVLQKAMC